ncbi:hypothetical protein HV824_18740 [Myxococcus sp. AM009]|uniref:hypothetical protein n=1 Tax=unclassified Myxococcus TaxID=2648731 RepID=UPI001594EBBC|nr:MULTISPECIES: hypothetical protein [unclassified Myxococcus]NVJ00149.1 hypothetical protein [Myxococcus sp. AM009]NVJ14940.1 hypothetical protein [Myxococcus sp. AM010]
MSTKDSVQSILAVVEIGAPLAVGILQGILVLKFVKPRLLARMGGLASVVHSRANTLLSVVQMMVLLGVVVACSAAYAPRTLAWLLERDLLPFEPTPLVLRVAAVIAAYLSGANLVHLTTALSSEQASNTLEPMPLSDRRP